MKRRWLVLLLLAAGPAAVARQPDGTLGIIRAPNNGIPVIVLPGATFEAALTSQAELRLADANGQHALSVEWSALPDGFANGHCTVPAETAAGTYALEASVNGQTDRNERAVFVRGTFPDTYILAHLTDTHIGANRNNRASGEVLRGAIDVLNKSEAAFVAVTGDLTDGGEIGQFQTFLKVIDTCLLPTFVCPGNHDRKALNYESFFGTLTYMFWFGRDGYLCFDTKDFMTADELGSQDADLEIYRRAIKPARWSIGLTHRYEPDMGMRSQIVLFIDDPLDHLVMGHWHRANEDNEKTVPWGTTTLTVTPAAVDGFGRMFDISPKGVKPRPPQRIVTTE
jgi:predicted phosphodiesterase